MSFSPLFYVNSVFCMRVMCLLSFVDFNKIFYPKKYNNSALSVVNQVVGNGLLMPILITA